MRRGIAYTVGAQLGIQAIGLGTGVLIARLLGPDGRGQLAAVIGWASMLAYLGNLGLPVALAYASARYPQERHQLLGNGAIVAVGQWLILAAFGWVVLPTALAGFGAKISYLAVLYLWAYLPLNLITLYTNAIQQGSRLYGGFNAVRLSVPFGYAFVLLLLWATTHLDVTGVVVANLLSNFLAAMLALGLMTPALVRLSRKSDVSWFDGKNLRRDLKYGLTAQIGTLQLFTGLQIDVLALTLMSGSHELGLYMAALAGSNLVRAQGTALGQVVLPEVARHDDIIRQKRIIYRTVSLAIGGSTVAVVTVLFWSKTLLHFVYGAAFVPGALILQILVLAGAVKTVERVVADGLRGMGYPSVSTKAELLSLAVGVPALAVCVPLWAGAGAAAAVLAASLVSLGVVLWGAWARSPAHSSTGVAPNAA